MLPEPPSGLSDRDRENFVRHFAKREAAEAEYFGEQRPPGCSTLEVGRGDLNSSQTAEFVQRFKPDVVLIFGCGLIKDPLVGVLPWDSINLHRGLSPRYRGAATLLWPFYFLEPSYAGTTFHHIVAEPDAGEIVHQVVPEVALEDGIHDVACKVVLQSSAEMLKLLDIRRARGRWESFRQRGTGKDFLGTDFRPEHLRVIYDMYNDEMVRDWLEGRMHCGRPTLVRQW